MSQQTQINTSTPIDLSNLNTGVYLLEIIDERGRSVLSERIIKE